MNSKIYIYTSSDQSATKFNSEIQLMVKTTIQHAHFPKIDNHVNLKTCGFNFV